MKGTSMNISPTPWRASAWHIIDANGQWIAGATDRPPVKVQEANTRLQAAAPDLLEALEGLLALTPETRRNSYEQPVYDLATQAIAKAKGEPK